jgi:hypothetical protein
MLNSSTLASKFCLFEEKLAALKGVIITPRTNPDPSMVSFPCGLAVQFFLRLSCRIMKGLRSKSCFLKKASRSPASQRAPVKT